MATPHVADVALYHLALVHGVEIDLGGIVLDGLEAHPDGLLDAISSEVSSRIFTTPAPPEHTIWGLR